MDFTGNPQGKKDYENKLVDELAGPEAEAIIKERETEAFEPDSDLTDEKLEQDFRQQQADAEEYAVWDQVENVERPNDQDAEEFIEAGDFMRGLGYQTPEELPEGHPLKNIDQGEYLTFGQLKEIQEFEMGSAPSMKAARVYDAFTRGDSPAQSQIAIDKLDYEELVHLHRHIEKHGPVAGLDGFDVDLRMAELERQRGAADNENEDLLDDILRRTGVMTVGTDPRDIGRGEVHAHYPVG